MNTIEFTHPNGFPWTQKTLRFLQGASYDDMKALVALCGCEASKSYILNGCTLQNGTISAGWLIIGNEVYPFDGGTGSAIGIQESRENAEYRNGDVKGVYIVKKAVINSNGTPISQFVRLTNIKDLLSGVPNATTTAKGVIEIATTSEVVSGSSSNLAVTPKTLKDAGYPRDPNYNHTDNNFTSGHKSKLEGIGNASENKAGLAERANSTEGQSGTDNVRFMTSYLTKLIINKLVKPATETLAGLVRRATSSEANIGTNNTSFTTPKLVKQMIDLFVPTATTSKQGKVELSTLSEARSGTAGKVITADILKTEINRVISMISQNERILYSGTFYYGDITSEYPKRVTFPNVGTANYSVAIAFTTSKGGNEAHWDNDFSYVINDKTATSFGIALREYAGHTQRIYVDHTIVKKG